MTKPKKSQKPAYVVRSPKKDHRDTSLAESSHSSRKKLKADLPQDDQSEMANRKSKRDAFRHNIRERHARLKASTGPTRSLMSIDFTSMGLNSLERSTSSQTYTKPQSSNSSDEESQSDRRNDWKRSQGNQNHRESTNHGAVSSSNQGIWRRPRSSSHAPIIVDMRHHNIGIDLQSPNQPKSLLGDYWASVAPKPTSLMNFKAKDSMGHYIIQQETYSRRDDFTSHLNPQRTLLPGSRGEEPSSRKHLRRSADDSMAPERKSLKTDQCKQVPAELSHRLHVLKNKGHAFVLIPSACATTYLHGRAKVTILKGNVSILNYRLEEGRQYEVFSPTSGSLLALTCTCTDEFKLTREEVRQKLLTFGLSENDKELESIGNSTVALAMLTKLESTMSDYITSFIPYTQLFTAPETREKDAHALKGITLPELGLKLAPMKEMGPMCLTMSHDYEDVLQRLTAQLGKSTSSKVPPIWLCCGAKNSGKSTFCRMLINTALKSVKAVGFLECDVGQTEFSPPATLSFHIIDKPILGQPFCHQRHAERMVFYGEIKAGYDPSMYIKCLKHVLLAYTDLEDKPPLIVNTMGFPEGIGLMLMIDTVQLVQPDLVVQIESHNQAVNFPAITHELVALDEGWTCNKSPVSNPKQKMEKTHAHELILLPTLVNHRRDFSLKLKPVDLRNLSLLASLSLGLESGSTLTSLSPYTVPFRQLAMHVCHYRLSGLDILAAVNASVVALCTADISQAQREDDNMPVLFDEMPVCDCHGLAIVRAIDLQQGLLYLVTTLPRASLMKVNTVLKGCLALPDQIILKQKSSHTDPLPYVDALAPSTGVSAVRPRTRMPRITFGANSDNT